MGGFSCSIVYSQKLDINTNTQKKLGIQFLPKDV